MYIPTIENKDLKQTMGWDNKGKMHGANYNWHKDNPKFWDPNCMNKYRNSIIFCRW